MAKTTKQAKNRGEKPQRQVGTATRKGFDLPLEQRMGEQFLILLVALMTILATLTTYAAVHLRDISRTWSSGLEGRVTVEIPATGEQGEVLDRAVLQKRISRIESIVANHPGVASVDVLSEQEVAGLVSPWLGQSRDLLETMPLPGLITLRVAKQDSRNLETLERRLRTVHPGAAIDTHDKWLSAILRLTGALQTGAMALIILVSVITFASIAGAVRARMAIHKDELELLHLIGATDRYISGQFLKHMSGILLKGTLAGVGLTALILVLLNRIVSAEGVYAALVPDITFTTYQIILLACIPVAIILIALLTTRWTVGRVLRQLP